MASDTETSQNQSASSFALWREIGGIILIASALCVLLAVVSFDATDLQGTSGNLIGPVGAYTADALLYLFGLASFCFDLILWYLGFNLLIGRHVEWQWKEIVGGLIFVGSGCVAGHLGLEGYIFFDHQPGGLIGAYAGEIARSLFGTVGASILSGSLLLLGLMLVTDLSIGSIARGGVKSIHRAQAWVRHKLKVRRQYKQRLAEQRKKLAGLSDEAIEEAAKADAELSVRPLLEEHGFDEDLDEEVAERLTDKLAEILQDRIEDSDLDTGQGDKKRSKKQKSKKKSEKPSKKTGSTSDSADADGQKDSAAPSGGADGDWSMGDGSGGPDEQGRQEPEIVIHGGDEDGPASDGKQAGEQDAQPSGNASSGGSGNDTKVDMKSERGPSGPVGGDFGPEIVESEAQKQSREKQAELEADDSGMLFKPEKRGDYELPPLKFLNYEADEVGIDPEALRDMAAEIEKTLKDFKIDGTVVEICPGPVITMFEFKPAPGTKISKIANREDDLLMNLAAKSVRVIAPIPGKPVVGIEVSNPEREMVWLKEVLVDDTFQDNDMHLPLALGKGTAGEIETTDLAKMPHLLVAGATGSGKSVAVNSMICSLLYEFTPDELQMIMIDPKVLEFSVYNGIPHLRLPVVTDPKQATVALNWAVQEMERRYARLAELGVRDIRGYNRKVKKLTEQAEADQAAGKEESDALKKLGVDADGNPEHTPLPYLVVIIDEFADLMMTASKEVEQAVARLAQKARAAGVHMILATQRPSTDVITGMIKANFPARIALRVTSRTDSRVILGSNGAENLLGNGDMLIMPPGSSDLERVHGAFVSDEEIEEIVEFVSGQVETDYDESILEEEDEETESPLDREMEKDEYYEDAVRLVVQKNKASISMIQRKLRVGYNRAARMVDMMEQDGYVGPSDGVTAREVIIDEVPFEEADDREE